MSFNKESLHKVHSRIEMANPDNLNEAQRVVYDKIVSGKRGKVVGPLRVVLHSPELADRWQAIGEHLRFDTGLPSVITELAIIATGRFWNSQVEWVIHARIAAEVGVSGDIIEAIRTSTPPFLEDSLQALVYDFTRQVLEFGQVDDELYEALLNSIGTKSLVELTAIIGYYSMVSMTLNVHHVPVPESENARRLECVDHSPLRRTTPLPERIKVAADCDI
jgi:4-carboxymuconolactone decarboxylase